MWANAQRDGRPAEYRWRPLFNAAKFGWRLLVECCAVTLPTCETHWNLHGCLKVANRSQPVVGRSSPYYEDMWKRYLCLTSFSDCQYVRWYRDCDFCVLYLQRAACSTFQTCILNSHQGHTMCRSMVDIQFATARRGKKIEEERRKIETTGQKYNGPYYIGRP